tara:strand:+ start:3741 stop:4598 length:858 start_codon:yes stop_codon:yes gene_type:complete
MNNSLLTFGQLLPDDHDYFNKNGFCLKSNFVDSNLIDSIKKESKEIFAKQILKNRILLNSLEDKYFEPALYKLFNTDFTAFIGAAKLCQHTFGMHQLAVSSYLLENLKKLGLTHPTICVKPLIFFNSSSISKIEGHFKTPAHQDWRSMQGSLNSLIVWIPLVDISRNLGTLEIVPGSHLNGLYKSVEDDWFRRIPESEIPESDYVSIDVKKGDVLFFSSLLVHRSGNNITDNIRWSMHFRYNDADEETFVERSFPHPYKVYQPDKELVTPRFPSNIDINKTFGYE